MKNILLADTSSLTSSRGLGQRIAYGVALGSNLCAILCLAAIFVWHGELGSEHPVIASLGASLVFFVGVGIVLHSAVPICPAWGLARRRSGFSGWGESLSGRKIGFVS